MLLKLFSSYNCNKQTYIREKQTLKEAKSSKFAASLLAKAVAAKDATGKSLKSGFGFIGDKLSKAASKVGSAAKFFAKKVWDALPEGDLVMTKEEYNNKWERYWDRDNPTARQAAPAQRHSDPGPLREQETIATSQRRFSAPPAARGERRKWRKGVLKQVQIETLETKALSLGSILKNKEGRQEAIDTIDQHVSKLEEMAMILEASRDSKDDAKIQKREDATDVIVASYRFLYQNMHELKYGIFATSSEEEKKCYIGQVTELYKRLSELEKGPLSPRKESELHFKKHANTSVLGPQQKIMDDYEEFCELAQIK